MPIVKNLYSGVNAANIKTLEKYARELRLTDKSENTIKSYDRYLVKYARFLNNKKFIDAVKQDTMEFIENCNLADTSIETMKIILKRFYRWLHDIEKGDRLPDNVRWMKLKTQRQKDKNKDIDHKKKMTISHEEYQQMLNATGDLEYKAILQTLYLYGCRIGELLSMNIGGISQNDIGVEIKIRHSKTEPRPITVEEYPKYLMDWIDAHPFKDQPDKPVWINLNTDHRVYKTRLYENAVEKKMHHIARDAGIKKRIHPHMFRHSAITRDCKNGMPWTHVTTKYGLSKNSRMQVIYDHSKHDEYLEWLRKKSDHEEPQSYNEIKKEKELLKNKYDKEIQDLQSRMQRFEDLLEQKNHLLNLYKNQIKTKKH